MFFKNIKISTKLIVAPLVFFAIVGVAGFFGYQTSKNILISELETRFACESGNVMNTVDMIMHGNYNDIQAFAKGGALTRGTSSQEEITAYLQREKEKSEFESLSYFNINRIRVADTENVGIGKQHLLEGFWHDVLQGKVSAGFDIRMGLERKIPIIYFAAPVENEIGEQIGVIVARYNPEEINNIIRATATATAADTTLFDKDKNIIFSNDPYYKNKILKEKIAESLSVKKVLKGNNGVVEEYNQHSNSDIITGYAHEKGYKDFVGNNWSLILSIDKEKALALMAVFQKMSLIITFIALVLIIVIIFLFFRLISKPIKKLSQTAQAIAGGDLSKRAEVKSKDEVGQLAGSFNIMVENLIVTRKLPENIIRSMGDSLIVVTPEAKIKEVNQATLDLLGYERKELIGQPIERVFGRAAAAAAAAAAAETIFKGAGLEKLIKGGAIKDKEMTYQTKQDKEIPVVISGSVMKDEKDKLIGIVVVAKDMREILKLEEEKRNVEVAAAAAAAAAAAEKSKRELAEKMARELEQKVKERTVQLDVSNQQLKSSNQQMEVTNQQLAVAQKQLQGKIVELERFNKITMGREVRILELKEEVARLKGKEKNVISQKTSKKQKKV